MSSNPESDNPLPQEDAEEHRFLRMRCRTSSGATIIRTFGNGARRMTILQKRRPSIEKDKSERPPQHEFMKANERRLRSVQDIYIRLAEETDCWRRRLVDLKSRSVEYTEAETRRMADDVMANFYDAIRRAETSLNGIASGIFRDINATGEIATKETVPESSAPPADE